MDPIHDALTRPGGIAERLVRLREGAGLAAKDLAEETGFYASKVSRLENGKQTPSSEDIRKWVHACGADDAVADELINTVSAAQVQRKSWRMEMRRGQVGVQTDYNKLAAEARFIRHFELVAVPGLIQTPGYAREMAVAVGRDNSEVDDVDATVAKRMERQRHLYESGRSFEFLLAEPVLGWGICPPDVMRGQLDRLHAVIGMPQVRFGILPLHGRLRTIPVNSVVLYHGEEATASVETFVGAGLHRGEEAHIFDAKLDKLWEDAVEGEAARPLINAAIEALSRSD